MKSSLFLLLISSITITLAHSQIQLGIKGGTSLVTLAGGSETDPGISTRFVSQYRLPFQLGIFSQMGIGLVYSCKAEAYSFLDLAPIRSELKSKPAYL
ncbi:MAG: hypothetical protein MRZ79_09570 [Bacteroidia bacterium]|nr:hypothetical protein [Bacteroidia bacterium]